MKDFLHGHEHHEEEEYEYEKKTFLLILNYAYLRKITFDNLYKLENFNREFLIAYFIRKQPLNNSIEELDSTTFKNIKNIDPRTFNGLTYLEEIDFS